MRILVREQHSALDSGRVYVPNGRNVAITVLTKANKLAVT